MKDGSYTGDAADCSCIGEQLASASGFRYQRDMGVGMDKSKSLALIGAISTFTAIFASIRGDLIVAAAMFFVAAVFARRAHLGRKGENA
jgi:hypothetical protein